MPTMCVEPLRMVTHRPRSMPYCADMRNRDRHSGPARGCEPSPRPDGIDYVAAIRATSSGFTILFLGLLLAPVLGAVLAGATMFAELLACLVAGGVAGSRIGEGRLGHLQGAFGAVSAYLLVLPLLLLFPAGQDLERHVVYGLVMAAAGAVAGLLAARRRDVSSAG